MRSFLDGAQHDPDLDREEKGEDREEEEEGRLHGIKILVLLLAAFGLATLWMAVFADVGVTVLAVLNAMRALRV